MCLLVCACVCLFVVCWCLFLRFCVFENCRLRSVVRAGPYSSVVEHPLSKRKVGSSILPGGKCLHSFHALALAASLVSDAFLAHAFFLCHFALASRPSRYHHHLTVPCVCHIIDPIFPCFIEKCRANVALGSSIDDGLPADCFTHHHHHVIRVVLHLCLVQQTGVISTLTTAN